MWIEFADSGTKYVKQLTSFEMSMTGELKMLHCKFADGTTGLFVGYTNTETVAVYDLLRDKSDKSMISLTEIMGIWYLTGDPRAEYGAEKPKQFKHFKYSEKLGEKLEENKRKRFIDNLRIAQYSRLPKFTNRIMQASNPPREVAMLNAIQYAYRYPLFEVIDSYGFDIDNENAIADAIEVMNYLGKITGVRGASPSELYVTVAILIAYLTGCETELLDGLLWAVDGELTGCQTPSINLSSSGQSPADTNLYQVTSDTQAGINTAHATNLEAPLSNVKKNEEIDRLLEFTDR